MIVAVSLGVSSPADAFDRTLDNEQSVTSDGSRLRVSLRISGGQTSVDLRWDGGGGGGGGGGDGDCTYTVVEIPEASFSLRDAGEPPSEGARPFWIYCGGARTGATWVEQDDVVDFDALARTTAADYVQTVLGPGLSVGSNPESYGLVGMATWNWVDGWDGQPIAVPTVSAFGDNVDVTLRLHGVSWDFGDRTAAVAGDLGQAYPAESTVQHTYTDRSTSREHPDAAYTMAATVTISASYRLNGGPEIAVDPPLTTTATTPVIIRQAQAVLN